MYVCVYYVRGTPIIFTRFLVTFVLFYLVRLLYKEKEYYIFNFHYSIFPSFSFHRSLIYPHLLTLSPLYPLHCSLSHSYHHQHKILHLIHSIPLFTLYGPYTMPYHILYLILIYSILNLTIIIHSMPPIVLI